jgi:hypothetical protein
MNSQTDINRTTDKIGKECSENIPTSPFPTSPFPTDKNSVSTQTLIFNSPTEFMMNSETNKFPMMDIRMDARNKGVPEQYHQELVDIMERMRNGKVIEFGMWFKGEMDYPSIISRLIAEPTKLVSLSVAPKDDTIVYGSDHPPLRFLMVSEKFDDEDFALDIGRIVSLRLWNDWRHTGIWNASNMFEVSYLKLGNEFFDTSNIDELKEGLRLIEAKREAERAVEVIRQQALQQHQQELEERQREEKRLKKHLKKLRKEGERIAKMTDEEIATKKVMADLEKDRLKKIQEKKDIAFAAQFTEKAEKVEPTKTKKEKKRGNPYQKMLTLSREAGIKTINPDWVKWENENK